MVLSIGLCMFALVVYREDDPVWKGLKEIIQLGVGYIGLLLLNPNPLAYLNWEIFLHEALVFLHILQSEALIDFRSRLSFQRCLYSEQP